MDRFQRPIRTMSVDREPTATPTELRWRQVGPQPFAPSSLQQSSRSTAVRSQKYCLVSGLIRRDLRRGFLSGSAFMDQ